MSKIRRNDPCPCGSGKKYKKCCLSDDTSQRNRDATNNKLYQLHQALISEASTTYEQQINNQLERIEQEAFYPNLDDETRGVYQSGLIPWIMSSVPIFKSNETILKRFYLATHRGLSLRTKEILTQWIHASPSVYEVKSIDPSSKFMQIQDLRENTTFSIPFEHEDDFIEGSFLIGIVIPFMNHHNFLMTVIKLYDRNVSFYNKLLDTYKNKNLKEVFPNFLVDALNSDSVESNWKDDSHEQVAHLLTEHLSQKAVGDRVILEGISMWRTFCEMKNPTIQRIQTYAAAMDYYIQKVILKDANITQASIAKEYDTSASSLSTNYRRIDQALNQNE